MKITDLFYVKFKKTSWKQKTVAAGIGLNMVDISDIDYLEEYKPYFCIGIVIYFWYLTFGVRLPTRSSNE